MSECIVQGLPGAEEAPPVLRGDVGVAGAGPSAASVRDGKGGSSSSTAPKRTLQPSTALH